MTSSNERLDSPSIRKWAHTARGGAMEIGTLEGRVQVTADDVRVQEMLRQLQTPAGQGRLAALMRSQAGTDDGNGPYTVRADELDAEPGILWPAGCR